jgi:CheY-like chemotaxis protein
MANALVIDDNRLMADGLCNMLDFLGVKAKAVYGPRDAMLALGQAEPDIIFLDIHMVGLTGFEVMSFLRRYPHLADVPVVYVSSDDQPETLQKARKTGALAYIVKPPDMDHLERLLRAINLIQ